MLKELYSISIKIMEQLESKLKELRMKHIAIDSEIVAFENTVSQLNVTKEELEYEIIAVNTEILNLSGDLDDDTKLNLYRYLTKIDKIHSTLDEDDKFVLHLKYNAESGVTYNIDMSGDVSYIKITITTASKRVVDIIRKSFTNNYKECHDSRQSFFHTMNESMWTSGPYDCCSASFTYNKDIAKNLLCPMGEDCVPPRRHVPSHNV